MLLLLCGREWTLRCIHLTLGSVELHVLWSNHQLVKLCESLMFFLNLLYNNPLWEIIRYVATSDLRFYIDLRFKTSRYMLYGIINNLITVFSASSSSLSSYIHKKYIHNFIDSYSFLLNLIRLSLEHSYILGRNLLIRNGIKSSIFMHHVCRQCVNYLICLIIVWTQKIAIFRVH